MDLVSLDELSLRLNVAPETLLAVGVAAGIFATAARVRTLPLAQVPDLLTAFRAAHAHHHEGWDVPDWLRDSTDQAWRVIAELYREPMTRPASLPPSQGQQLHELILATAPKRVVEIGSFLGLSTLWIASALRILGAGKVHAVDPFEPKLPFAKTHCGCIVNAVEFVARAVTRAGVADFVSLEPGYSRQFARELHVTQRPEIDFLFIDGDHSVGGCLDDFVSYYPLVRRGGHILVHDIHPARCGWPGPRYLLDRIVAGNSRFKVHEIVTEPDYGMALITKLTDDRSLPGLTRMKADLIIYPHRAIQAAVRNRLLRRTLRPLLTAFKLRRAQLAAGRF